MKRFVLLFTILLPLNSSGQNDTTIYYSNLGESVKNREQAYYYEVMTRKSDTLFELKSYYSRNKKWTEATTSKIFRISDTSFVIVSDAGKSTRCVERKSEKYYIRDFQDGMLISEGTSELLFPLVKNGIWKDYSYASGRLTAEGEYQNNRMISNKYYINDTEYLPDVFYQVDSFPIYGNGDSDLFKFLFENIEYPPDARDNKITGKVIVKLVVMADGTVAGVEVLKAAYPALTAEALRVVKSLPPRWKPGIIDGKKVNSVMNIPITFTLIW